MLKVKPESNWNWKKIIFRGGKIAIAAELISLVGSYIAWREVNRNQG